MIEVINGDCIEVLTTLPSESVACCVTSPPYYGLRDYGDERQIGQEETPEAYIERLVRVFHEVRRVLCNDGTLWLNIGDSYAGSMQGIGGAGSTPSLNDTNRGTCAMREKGQKSVTARLDGYKPKDLIGIPWMLAFALRKDGWYLRQDIIWSKPNAMPESVKDRCTKSHEYLFLLSKNQRYYFDHEAMQETAVNDMVARTDNSPRYGGNKYTKNPETFYRTKSGNAYAYTGKRNRRDVWTISTQPSKGAHFAVFPEKLVEPCILAGTREGDTVLDPFGGSGTTGVVANRLARNAVIIEINPVYAEMSKRRTAQIGFAELLQSEET